MDESADGWPPAEWRWLPVDRHIPAMARDVAAVSQRVCRSRGLSVPHDSDDVAQEVLLKFLDAPKAAVPPATYRAFRWLASRTADNVARRIFRTLRPLLRTDRAGPDRPTHAWHKEYMAALPDELMQRVFYAHFVEDRSKRDVARQLGLTLDRVVFVLERVLRELKKRFAKSNPAGVPA